MKKILLSILGLFVSMYSCGQSVYMHEAQEESEGTSLFETILGFVIFVGIIKLISYISDERENKRKIKRQLEWEQELKIKRAEEERERKRKEVLKENFKKTLICSNVIMVGGYTAVDLGLSEFGEPLLFATENLGAKDSFDNGLLYGWGMNTPAKAQCSNLHLEPCPLKLKTLEELEIVCNQGDFKYDAASKERNGLWSTPNDSQIRLLMYNCKWQYIDKYNINGWKIIGLNGNFIFIPIDKNGYGQHLLLTSSASFDESKEESTELGRTKYAQFLELYNNEKPSLRIIEKLRLNVGYIRPITHNDDPIHLCYLTEEMPLDSVREATLS